MTMNGLRQLVHQVRGWCRGIQLKMSRWQGAEEGTYLNRSPTLPWPRYASLGLGALAPARTTKPSSATITRRAWITRHFAPHPVALSLAAGWILIFGGCQPKVTQTTPFGLRIAELKVSNVPLTTEIADTPQASENGLMFRESLPEDHGMLFIFEEPKKATFWMKNTKIPLSIAYVDSNGKILEIKSMKPLDETVVPSSSDEVAYALEVNQGWFARHQILTGAKIDGIPRK